MPIDPPPPRPGLPQLQYPVQVTRESPAPDAAAVRLRLLAWLRDRFGDAGIGYADPPGRLPGGTDTHTYRFGLANAPDGLGETLVLRLFPRAGGAQRAVRESRVQKALARTACPVPDVHMTCTDPSVLGGAFFIMQYLPGEPMSLAPAETVPGLLGTAHLALHRIDPAPVVARLREQGEAAAPRRAERELAGIAAYARRYPALGPVIGWMSEHLPPPPPRLSICHGDFHPLNIAVRAGEVTGVFDWTEFAVGDPIADVASTVTLGIPARRLFSPGLPPRLWNRYLETYRREAAVDLRILDYYRIRRCVIALLSGAGGRLIWRHSAIARDILADIRALTGIALAAPPWEQ